MHDVFFRIALFTTVAMPALSSPIYSSQTLYIMIPTGCTSICINSPGGNSLTYNFTNANNGQAASVVGSSFYATNGFDLGARTSATLNNASAGQYDVLGQISAHDTISIAGVSPGVHNIQFTYHLDGSFAFPNPAVGLAQLQLRGGLTSGLNGPFLAGDQGVSSATSQSIDQFFTFTNTVTFTGNPAQDHFTYGVFLRPTTQIDFSGASNITGVFTTDFSATVHLTGFSVDGSPGARAFDSSGQALTGTPEPATLSMGFLGLMVGFSPKVRRILTP